MGKRQGRGSSSAVALAVDGAAKRAGRPSGADSRAKLLTDLKKKYDAGATIRGLAEEYGRPYGTVHRMLRESGVTFRGRAGYKRRLAVPEVNPYPAGAKVRQHPSLVDRVFRPMSAKQAAAVSAAMRDPGLPRRKLPPRP